HLISPTPGIYTNTWPKLNTLLLPYLLPGPEAIDAAMNDELVGKEMLADLEAKNLKTVAIWMNGPRNVGSTRPLLTPADMNGVKVRVQPAAVFVESMKAFGANPVTMSWGEVPAALQQGVIDAVEPTPNAWLSSKLYETATHITDMRYVYSFYLVATNKNWWDGLSEDTRKALAAALDETTRWNWEEAEKANAEAEKEMESAGVTIHELSDEQMQKWVDAAKPVWASLGNPLVGEEVMKRLEEIGNKYR
ncbi:MAG: TRAP transporter substrate-binding protein, partial [Acetobacterales bacterium]